MSLEIQISSSLLLTCQVLFGVIFSEIMLKSFVCGLYMSAAYTQVFTVILFFNTNILSKLLLKRIVTLG